MRRGVAGPVRKGSTFPFDFCQWGFDQSLFPVLLGSTDIAGRTPVWSRWVVNQADYIFLLTWRLGNIRPRHIFVLAEASQDILLCYSSSPVVSNIHFSLFTVLHLLSIALFPVYCCTWQGWAGRNESITSFLNHSFMFIFLQHLKGKQYQNSTNSFQKLKRKNCFFTHFYKPSIILITNTTNKSKNKS